MPPEEYWRKGDFEKTPDPGPAVGGAEYVILEHRAPGPDTTSTRRAKGF